MAQELHITGAASSAPGGGARAGGSRGGEALRLRTGDRVVVDLDGVLWRGSSSIPGAASAVVALRDAGVRVAFFTNNSYSPMAAQLDKLRRHGVEAAASELLTSSQAAAGLVEAGERVLAVGGPGLLEALEERGAQVTEVASLTAGPPAAQGADLGAALAKLAEAPPFEVAAVVAGIDPFFDYARLAVASAAVRAGARLVATNTDATYPAGAGLVPGAGAVLAALAVASGATPTVAGKPHQPAADLVRRELGEVQAVIGDRPDTDGGFALRLEAPFALVLSGVTAPGHGPLDPEPDLEASDLAALVEVLLGR